MRITDLLSNDIKQAFPQRLETLPSHYFYHNEAIKQLADTLRHSVPGRDVLVLADQRTYGVAGDACVDSFVNSGWNVKKYLIPDPEPGCSPVCDDITQLHIQAELPGYDFLLAVGRGVVNDLAKWLSAEAGQPYAVIATAASMNGYTAANVAPMIKGLKSLFRARAPLAIAAEPGVICGAPYNLTASGLGDVIAKPVSTADWLINHLLFGEDYCQQVADIITGVEPVYTEHAAELRSRQPGAVRGLFEALILSGCAMTLQGSSMPASGGEHLVSHTIDIKTHLEGRSHDLHGRQVGVSTIFAAEIYQRLMHISGAKLFPDALSFDEAYWGDVGLPVRKQYLGAREKSRRAAALLSDHRTWERMISILNPVLRDPQLIKNCLKEAGAAHSLDDIGCSREQYRDAVLNCACMRERFTSIDLGFLLGILPGAVDEIIEQWLL